MKRDFLTFWELSKNEVESILERAACFKAGNTGNKSSLSGKSIGLFFEKSSTRTRVSFEVGIYQLGGQPVYIRSGDSQVGRGESISDTARVLSRYFDGLIVRTYAQVRLEEFAKYSTAPVINGLSDTHHPCQVLADLLTIKERKGKLQGIKLTYLGDSNNVTNSLIEASLRMGIVLSIASPAGFEPKPAMMKKLHDLDYQGIKIYNDPVEAVKQADVVYTDVWISMGDEETGQQKKKDALKPFQINDALLKHANPDVTVLHCLPAHRGEEITDSVIDGPMSAVFDQAENRLHTQKALLEMLIG
ncbi:MAG: ornithine carbamoyltransferase [Nitrospirae bacterium]|nr:ornithine carbamoyltransferase [Nitrospirota bacterium]MBF0535758.1 ornithine carbamoyltransferase [Nitrospirota bacterium]MBF0615787.1 ornithine carbamoyltransferase [Nitrospirota bacterium]